MDHWGRGDESSRAILSFPSSTVDNVSEFEDHLRSVLPRCYLEVIDLVIKETDQDKNDQSEMFQGNSEEEGEETRMSYPEETTTDQQRRKDPLEEPETEPC